MDAVSALQILSMANEGSKVIHPRAIKAALKTQNHDCCPQHFQQCPRYYYFSRTAAEDSIQVALAHRDEMSLLVFEAETGCRQIGP